MKIVAWTAAGIVFLLLVVVLLINIPAVQNYLVDKITTSVSSKTHSTVSIGRIGISFPKSVFLKDVFLDDEKKDTLLYAGEISVDIDMIALVSGDIAINNARVDHLKANIKRAANDSLFNFSFIVNSFSTGKPDTVVKAKKDSSNAAFTIAEVELHDIHLLFDDKYKGLLARADFENLEIKTNDLNFKNLHFGIDELLFSNAKLAVTISKKDTSTKAESTGTLPVFDVKKLALEKIDFKFLNTLDSQFISVTTDNFLIQNSNVELNTNHFMVDRIESRNTSFIMKTGIKQVPDVGTLQAARKNNVVASVKQIRLEGTIFQLDNNSGVKKANGFDANHLHIFNLNLVADEARYAEAETHSSIRSLSFNEANGFKLINLQSEILFTPTESQLKNLIVVTPKTKINSNLTCRYSSLHAFKDSLQEVFVNGDFSRSIIDQQDVIYFVPELAGKPFFMERSSPVTIEGDISGEIRNLKSKKLVVEAGKTTRIATSFQVTGLPNMDAAFFSIPELKLQTTEVDLTENIPATLIPSTIQVPSEVSINGSFKGTIKQFDSDLALRSSLGNVNAAIKMAPQEKYEATVNIDDFNLGKLLKNEKVLGPVTLSTHVKGSGFKKESANAAIELKVASIELNKYAYKDLHLDGKISDQQFAGKINLNDSNLSLAFDGMVGFKKGEEQYKFNLDLKGANLQKLNFMQDDIRIAANVEADLKGSDIDNLNGKAGISKIILIKGEKTYTLDSLLFASINEKGRSELSVSSAIIGIKFNGSVAPGKLVAEVTNHLNQYFKMRDSLPVITEKNNFSFKIELHNHPIISDVFLPSLTEFEPGIIEGSFDASRQVLDVKATIFKLNYGGIMIQDAAIQVKSDSAKLGYSVYANEISNSQVMLEKFDLSGTVKDNLIALGLNIGKDEKNRKLKLGAEITADQKGDYKIHFSKDVTLGGEKWNVPEANQIILSKNASPVIDFVLGKENERIAINSKDSSKMEIAFKDFELLNISKIIQKDTAIAEGRLNGNFTMMQQGAFVSDLQLNNLVIRSRHIGDISLSARNSSSSVIDLNMKLSGNGNNLSVTGNISPKQKEEVLNLKLAVQSINMESIEGFSFGQLQNSSGKITGEIECRGSFSLPKLNGQLHFVDVTTTPVAINNPLRLSNETISFTNSAIEFSSFTIRDKRDHLARINGSIATNDLSNPAFNLDIVTDHFLAINSTAESKQLYYGTLIIDSKIKLTGTPSFPRINADIKLDEGSYFTFAVPETKLTADKGEGVVEFTNARLDPILTKKERSQSQKSDFKNIDLVSDIRVDKNATLKLLIDPTSGDSLVVKGDAALSFALDPSGKISLTGRYELYDGSYLVSLEDLVKKKFVIEKGGTITWNGDPLDADIDMRAIYTVRTSAIDLVANEISSLSVAQQNSYKERLPFQVILKLKGQLLKPDISFEIQLPPESRGALGGAVYAKLNLLNADESELNKQVFALLVLNRFIQEDPLASAGGNSGAEGVARQSVSRFLSQQLNKMSEQYIKGVELNFDVQSYDDFTSGQSEGRTEVEIGLKKQFNPRFSVQVGGSVDVEGERTRQNNASELTGDILVEYKLTEDGRYRLKGFRQTEYEGVVEGQLTETGAGILYTRDFDKWNELFKKPE
ncbi:MAG: translocation/assembly module TamB domain-containing protein, partial [Bacteroidota bacterium]